MSLMIDRPRFEIRIGGRPVRLGLRTMVVGILNVTPDSFSDGGVYLDPQRAVEHAVDMASQGADWIDVGGESTRPGSSPVSTEEELDRVLPVIQSLRQRIPELPISVDTTKAAVAEAAIRAGANIVNDISGLRFDPEIAKAVRRHRVPLILMHIRGHPATMQRGPFARSIRRSLSRGLSWSIRRALSLGVKRSQLILDPGLGFGKTRDQNFEILAHLHMFRGFHLPLMIGSSRKSFIRAAVAGEPWDRLRRKTSGTGAETGKDPSIALSLPQAEALDFGDAAAAAAAVLGGAHIVRVHCVGAILPAVRVADAILAAPVYSSINARIEVHGR